MRSLVRSGRRKFLIFPRIAAADFMVPGELYGIEHVPGNMGFAAAILVPILFPFIWSGQTAPNTSELASFVPTADSSCIWARRTSKSLPDCGAPAIFLAIPYN